MEQKIRILAVFGTRPEAVKMAPLVLHLQSLPQIDCKVCVTAQHREMLDMVNKLFDIRPDADLNIMEQGQTLCGITAKVISGMEDVIKEHNPHVVLVHGDTSTSTAAALAAFYCNVKVGHVEAGLRTYDKHSPFPEEANRLITGQLADFHFCPTGSNAENLKKEGISKGIFVTGNTVIDAIRYTVDPNYSFQNPEIAHFFTLYKKMIVVTAHRRENFGEPLENIFSALKTIAEEFYDVGIIYPVHPNPRVKDVAEKMLGDIPNILLCPPIDTKEMHNLLARSYMVMTDSGGLQEEAPSFGKPVLVMRTETERPEAVQAGTVKVVGVRYEDIVREALSLLYNDDAYAKMAKATNPYGDGHASERIGEILLQSFQNVLLT